MKNLITVCKFDGTEYVRGSICICLLASANDPSPHSSPVRWPNDKPNSSGILGKTTPLLDCDTWRVLACEELLDSSPDANMHMHMQIDDALLMNT